MTQETDINLNEIVRAEVRRAIKLLLSQGLLSEEEKTLTRADNIQATKTANAPVVAKEVLPVIVTRSDGKVEHRRRKRTQIEIRDAIIKAVPIVKAKHPDWPDTRIRKLAKTLVRRYKL